MKPWKFALALAAATFSAGAAHAGGAAGLLIPDQYIVVLKSQTLPGPGAVRPVAQTLLGRVGGGELLQVYGHAINGFAVRIPAIAAAALAQNPLVASVEQDQTMRLVETQFNPPSYGLDRIDQHSLPLDRTYSFPAGTGSGAHVYVIDTGLRASHTDFAGRVGNGRNFAANSNGSVLCQLLGIGCPVPEPSNTNDCNGHGTHVSGTAAGTSFGVAKGATVHPVRVFSCSGSTATSTIIAGVDWVSGNRIAPAVANMSLGGAASATLDNAVRNLIAQGVSVVIAAGNSNADACNSSPGRVAEGITVAATDSADARASFSDFGSCVDVFAPGVNIVSASYQSDTGSATLSGTSMSSPHVTGAVARYVAVNQSATAAQVQSALTAAATPGVVGNPGTGTPNRLLYVNPNGP
jgi:subtilisin family serine protease